MKYTNWWVREGKGASLEILLSSLEARNFSRSEPIPRRRDEQLSRARVAKVVNSLSKRSIWPTKKRKRPKSRSCSPRRESRPAGEMEACKVKSWRRTPSAVEVRPKTWEIKRSFLARCLSRSEVAVPTDDQGSVRFARAAFRSVCNAHAWERRFASREVNFAEDDSSFKKRFSREREATNKLGKFCILTRKTLAQKINDGSARWSTWRCRLRRHGRLNRRRSRRRQKRLRWRDNRLRRKLHSRRSNGLNTVVGAEE